MLNTENQRQNKEDKLGVVVDEAGQSGWMT